MRVKETVRPKTGIGVTIFLVVAVLVTAMTAFILAVPIDAADFESTTGVNWESFSASAPEVADYLTREARLLAVGFLGLTLLAAAIAWGFLRRGAPGAKGALFVFPAALVGAAIVFFAGGGSVLGATYLGAASMAGLGLALAGRADRA